MVRVSLSVAQKRGVQRATTALLSFVRFACRPASVRCMVSATQKWRAQSASAYCLIVIFLILRGTAAAQQGRTQVCCRLAAQQRRMQAAPSLRRIGGGGIGKSRVVIIKFLAG